MEGKLRQSEECILFFFFRFQSLLEPFDQYAIVAQSALVAMRSTCSASRVGSATLLRTLVGVMSPLRTMLVRSGATGRSLSSSQTSTPAAASWGQPRAAVPTWVVIPHMSKLWLHFQRLADYLFAT